MLSLPTFYFMVKTEKYIISFILPERNMNLLSKTNHMGKKIFYLIDNISSYQYLYVRMLRSNHHETKTV